MKHAYRFFTVVFLAASIVFGILAAAHLRLPLQELIFASEYRRDIVPSSAQEIQQASQSVWLLAAITAAGLTLLLAIWSNRQRFRERAHDVLSFSITTACALTLFLLLTKAGFEGSWYPLDTIVNKPGQLPVFGTRLLMVWLAWLLRAIHSMPVHRLFLATQGIALIAAVFMTRTWSALFIGKRLSWLGPVLLVLLLAPTFTYFTFYDIAMVFFWSLGLWAIWRRYYVLLVAVVFIGTLNHENILLLVPVSAVAMWQSSNRRVVITTASVALVAHAAARLLLNWLYPTKRIAQMNILLNAQILTHARDDRMLDAILVLPVLFLCTVIASFYAEQALQRAWYTGLAVFLAVTFAVGQANEVRQFDALIPLVIALLLNYMRQQLQLQPAEGTP